MVLRLIAPIAETASQLEISGLDHALRQAQLGANSAVRSRMTRKVETAHDLLSEMPSSDDLAFSHAGLCQTFLPHRALKENHTVWRRESGRFTLWVRPGVLRDRSDPKADTNSDADYVGVPFGPKARLILIYLQTEGLKSREVYLGKNLSAFLRSLGVPNSGGPRGAISQVKEQFKRITRCSFTMQFDGDDSIDISDTSIVDGVRLWNMSSDDWNATVHLSEKFHRHLVHHSVPLDRRAIAHLANNSLGLDLYALMAYRLPKLKQDLRLSWDKLQGQIGSEYAQTRDLSKAIRAVMPDLKIAYPHANVEIGRGGLIFRNSPPPIPPKAQVNGHRLRVLD